MTSTPTPHEILRDQLAREDAIEYRRPKCEAVHPLALHTDRSAIVCDLSPDHEGDHEDHSHEHSAGEVLCWEVASMTIPADFAVQPLTEDEDGADVVFCHVCELFWDAALVPSTHVFESCPFEQLHTAAQVDAARRKGFDA